MRYLTAGLLALVVALGHTVWAQELTDLETVRSIAAKGDRDTALAKLDELIAADRTDLQARFLRGLFLLKKGDNVTAQEDFTEIARLFPRLPEAFNNLAAIYVLDGEYEKARQALLSAIANAPTYGIARANLGDLYVKLAADAYRKVIELDPKNEAAQAKLRMLEQMFAPGG